MRSMRRIATTALLIVVAVVALAGIVSPLRRAALRAAGGVLIVSDPVESADVGAMTESGEAGELEVGDLYRAGVISRVLVLVPSPTSVEREYARRGVHRDDIVVTTLVQLGVPRSAITTVEAGEGGTTESTQALAAWAAEHPCRVVVVVEPTHARRYRRTLLRVWPPHVEAPRIVYPRANPFRAEDWWQSRRTLRSGVFELQKLIWDYVQHPW
jgi:hypothetical protein